MKSLQTRIKALENNQKHNDMNVAVLIKSGEKFSFHYTSTGHKVFESFHEYHAWFNTLDIKPNIFNVEVVNQRLHHEHT